MNKNTGGPVFPVVGHFYGDKLGGQLDHGMTLRDYFAAKAMQALVKTNYFDSTAEMAYEMADAMLKAREASNG